MKALLFVVLSIITFAFAACSLNGESNYTPQIYIKTSHASKNDTILFSTIYESGQALLKLDTINVGDTILFKVALNGITNNLTNFSITRNDTSITKIILPSAASIDTIFSKTESSYSNCRFVFLPKQALVLLPFKYVALTPTTDHVNFSVTSDATFKNSYGDNTANVRIKVIAKQKQ
jgi:hypothetical protein